MAAAPGWNILQYLTRPRSALKAQGSMSSVASAMHAQEAIRASQQKREFEESRVAAERTRQRNLLAAQTTLNRLEGLPPVDAPAFGTVYAAAQARVDPVLGKLQPGAALGTFGAPPPPEAAPEAATAPVGVPTTREGIKALQQELVAEGYDIGTTGPNKDGVDGDMGKATFAASAQRLAKRAAAQAEAVPQAAPQAAPLRRPVSPTGGPGAVPLTGQPLPPTAQAPAPPVPARAQPPTAAPQQYKVQQDDTLGKIAAKVGVPPSALIAANPQIKNPNLIEIDDAINIPSAPAAAPPAAAVAPRMPVTPIGGAGAPPLAGQPLQSTPGRPGAQPVTQESIEAQKQSLRAYTTMLREMGDPRQRKKWEPLEKYAASFTAGELKDPSLNDVRHAQRTPQYYEWLMKLRHDWPLEGRTAGAPRMTQNVGAAGELPTAMKTHLMKQLDSAADSHGHLDAIGRISNGGTDFGRFLTLQSKIGHTWNALKDYTGFLTDPEDIKAYEDYKVFVGATQYFAGPAFHELIGAAQTRTELKRIKNAFLSEKMSPVEYKASYNRLRRQITLIEETKRAILADRGFKVLDMETYHAEHKKRALAAEKAAARRRFNELKTVTPSMPEATIWQQLQQEGYTSLPQSGPWTKVD